ncbi:MAG: hypothetical protein LBT38_05855 [Deltaproteobacteria bacterium]|nr:hypothetical protein [Deltaproteobacteria bacterium]
MIRFPLRTPYSLAKAILSINAKNLYAQNPKKYRLLFAPAIDATLKA